MPDEPVATGSGQVNRLAVSRYFAEDPSLQFNYLPTAGRADTRQLASAEWQEAYLFDDASGGFEDLHSGTAAQQPHSRVTDNLDDWILDPDPAYLYAGSRQDERPFINWDV